MTFCEKYQEFMQKQEQKELPVLGFEDLKRVLRKCKDIDESHNDDKSVAIVGSSNVACPQQCRVCDGTFFPSLQKQMSQVLECFNKRAKKLLDIHLAKGLKKIHLRFKGELHKDHAHLVQEVQDLITYAMVNAVALRKILHKYDKIHCCKPGEKFKSRVQSLHLDILQSPRLFELMAMRMNLEEKKVNGRNSVVVFDGYSLTFNDGKLSLSCEVFDSVKLDVDLTCPICLDTVFDAVSLSCGHIMCLTCACSAASVSIVNGLEAAHPHRQCPLCRESGVFKGVAHLAEINILLGRECPEYWEQRLQSERCERLKQAKEYYESLYQPFVS